MTEKVVHGADPWGWEKVPRSELVALACMSPHSCDARGCPGPENKRKLEAFHGLLAALVECEALLTHYYTGSFSPSHALLEELALARAAIAKASPQAP